MFKYNEVVGNIFDYEDDYVLAHCISADLGLSTGLAKKMQVRYNIRDWIQKAHGDLNFCGRGYCILSNNGHIFNLIVQQQEYGPFTYEAAANALREMLSIMQRANIKKIAMPKIGTGLAGLDWDIMHKIIFDIFGETEVEIKVVYPVETRVLKIEEPDTGCAF